MSLSLGGTSLDRGRQCSTPVSYGFQPSEHPQCSGFSTTGWTDQNHEFAFPNIKAYAFDRSYSRSLSRTRIDFGKIGTTHPGHIEGRTLKLYRLMGSEKPTALRFTQIQRHQCFTAVPLFTGRVIFLFARDVFGLSPKPGNET